MTIKEQVERIAKYIIANTKDYKSGSFATYNGVTLYTSKSDYDEKTKEFKDGAYLSLKHDGTEFTFANNKVFNFTLGSKAAEQMSEGAIVVSLAQWLSQIEEVTAHEDYKVEAGSYAQLKEGYQPKELVVTKEIINHEQKVKADLLEQLLNRNLTIGEK